jgi:hypothetical protein
MTKENVSRYLELTQRLEAGRLVALYRRYRDRLDPKTPAAQRTDAILQCCGEHFEIVAKTRVFLVADRDPAHPGEPSPRYLSFLDGLAASVLKNADDLFDIRRAVRLRLLEAMREHRDAWAAAARIEILEHERRELASAPQPTTVAESPDFDPEALIKGKEFITYQTATKVLHCKEANIRKLVRDKKLTAIGRNSKKPQITTQSLRTHLGLPTNL